MSNQLISSQIHDLQGTCGKQTDLSDKKKKSNSLPLMSHRAATDAKQHRRSTSNLSDAGGQFFSQFSSKYSSQLIDKFIRSELLNSSYYSQKCQSGYSTPLYSNQVSDLRGFDSLQGSYRNHGDGEIYEIVQVKHPGSKYSYEEQASCKTIHHQKVKERSPQPMLDTHTSDNYPAHRGRGVGFRSQKQSIAPVST